MKQNHMAYSVEGVQIGVSKGLAIVGLEGVMGVGEELYYFLNIAQPLNTAFLSIMICAHI